MGLRVAKLTIIAAVIVLGLLETGLSAPHSGLREVDAQRSRTRRRATRPSASQPRAEPQRFSHRTPRHRRACDACHTFPSKNWKAVRSEDDAFPDVTDYPDHASCLGCHRTEFFARERPAPKICSVCHVAVTPRRTERLPFPNPVEAYRASDRGRTARSSFRVEFPHASHLELFADARRGDGAIFRTVAMRSQPQAPLSSCSKCHELVDPQGDSSARYATPPPEGFDGDFWLLKGTFMSSPMGHDTCFTCHMEESGLPVEPKNCGACHKLIERDEPLPNDFDPSVAATMGVTDPKILSLWRKRDDSATFPHEGGLHTEVACTDCHDVLRMNTADPRTTKVRVQSCGGDMGCHVTATEDEGGAVTFEAARRAADPGFTCTKCHLSYGTKPLPRSHLAAIEKLRSE